MKFVKKTLKDMLDEIGNAEIIRFDTIIPSSYYPEDPKELIQKGDLKKYSWLWQYEKELTNFIKKQSLPIKIELGTSVNQNGYVTYPINGAITSVFKQNSDLVGEREIFNIPIHLDVYRGDKGIVFTVSSDLGNKVTYDDSHDDKKAPHEISEEKDRINVAYSFEVANDQK